MQALRALSRVVLWIVANPSRTLDDVESITKWLLSPGAVHLLLSPAHADTEFILALAYHMHARPCLGPYHSSPARRNPPSRRPLAYAWRQAHPRALLGRARACCVGGLRVQRGPSGFSPDRSRRMRRSPPHAPFDIPRLHGHPRGGVAGGS